LARARKKML